ncbi:MAG: acetate non-utilizing protein 9 [Piccolia ochrophora]|nr:MAG: acetate non-utilizing protein 9 [Piccolia ochrophora]
MRPHPRLLATLTTPSASSPLSSAPLALLPPIPLYRRLLRAHRRHLEPAQRTIGDQYVSAEFRRHRDVENPVHIIGFLTEWQMYAQAVEGDQWRGEKLDRGKVDKMSDQQLGQLHELMTAIKEQGRRDGDDEQG